MKGAGQTTRPDHTAGPRRKGLPPATFLAGLLTQPKSKEIDHIKSFFVVLFEAMLRDRLGGCGQHADEQARPFSEDRHGSVSAPAFPLPHKPSQHGFFRGTPTLEKRHQGPSKLILHPTGTDILFLWAGLFFISSFLCSAPAFL